VAANPQGGERMRKYETAVIFDLDWEEEDRNAFVERLENIITDFSGEVFDKEDWGGRKLAYKILKKNSGRYLFLRYSGKAGVVEEIERVMGLNEKILRYLTTRFEKDIKGKYPMPPSIDEFLDRDITELQTLKAQWRGEASVQTPADQKTPERESKEKPEVESKEVESKEVESKEVESKEVESKEVESKETESKETESKEVESKETESTNELDEEQAVDTNDEGEQK
jgi:small subunit ribosomal protein S6